VIRSPRNASESRAESRATNVDGIGSEPAAAERHPLWATIATLAAVVAANSLALTHSRLPFIEAALGLWVIVLLPVYLLYTTSLWPECSAAERLGYCLGSVVLTLMLSGLIINAALPLITIREPLGVVPVVALSDLINLSLWLIRRMRPYVVPWRRHLAAVSTEETRLVSIALLSVLLAVLGANRLNNGAGDQLSLVAVGTILLTLICQLYWASKVREGAMCIALYLASLALLLSTSLRGWYVTGHDIQNEYRVFQLTADHAHWSMSYWHNAYNACLSITILPTEISRVVGIDDPYVFKVIFQAIFAMCPVLVYALVRRYWSASIAVLAAAYFIGFPTFFTDMPFLNRQEIGYLFVAVAVLAATNPAWGLRMRQVALVAAGVGIDLSHYSSMYFFLGLLVVAWASRQLVSVVRRFVQGRRSEAGITHTTTISSILALGLIVFVWGGLATQTAGQVVSTGESVAAAVAGHVTGVRSGNVGYSVLAGKTASEQTLLHSYRTTTLRSASTAPDVYLPSSSLSKIGTPLATVPVRPLTSIGRALSTVGVPVVGANSLIRKLTAYAEQIFIGLGILELILLFKRRQDVSGEFFWLCIGGTIVLVLITVLPAVSSDFGVLRAFQGALIVLAPVIVLGSTTAIRWLGRRRLALVAGPAICLVFFAVTSSLLPQLIGGNQAELNLNNSGSYYDAYYMDAQEEAAVGWLGQQRYVLSDGIQGSYQQDRFAFMNPGHVSGTETIGTVFPTLIRRSSWVILSYSMIHEDLAVVSLSGNLIEYRYPLGLLSSNKNLVYSNGGSEIYQ
jgi:uncharacterized membrane protein